MNSPSPLIPQGSNLEQHNQARSSLKVKIFCAIGVNVAILLVLLMQGCKREQPPVEIPVDPTAVTDVAPVYDGSNPPPVVDPYQQPGVADPAGGSNIVANPEPPVVPPIQPVIPPPSATEYKIEKGDSFYTIGKKFGVSSKAIQAANPNVDPTKLQIGKTIQIPAPSAAPAAGAGPVVDVATGETTHTVKSGDNLSKIAAQYHTTVAAIKSANGLSTDRIKVGDKLKIPAK
jgi:LysM repeat protein